MVSRTSHVPGPSTQHLLDGRQRREDEPGWLRLTLQGNRWFDNPTAPRVSLNGYPVAASYGENLVQVPAGRVEVDVHCRLLKRYGDARLDVDVLPGATVPVFYAPPHHELSHGRLGHEPQRRAGVVPVLGLALVVLNVLLVVLHVWVG